MITKLLIKTFVKDYDNIEDTQVRSQYGIMEGWISVVINSLLFIIKLAAGMLVNSIALIADAFHSISDMFSSAAVIWGFKIAATPADQEHPFGHERMEYIATLIIAILLVITGFEFLRAAYDRIAHPEPVIFSKVVIFIISLTIIIKGWLAYFSKELGRQIDSKALIGDFIHHQTDAITTFIVLLALFSEKIHFRQFDGIVGIVVSLFVMYSGWAMMRDVVSPLLGESATYEELKQIKLIAMSAKGIKGVHDIILHKYGKVRIISLHVELPEEHSFMKAHNIIEEVEEAISTKMKATTTIHLDPIQKLDDKLREVHTILNVMIKSNPKLDSYHDVRIMNMKGKPTLVLDIVAVDGISQKGIRALRKELISILKSSLPLYTIKIWIDPKFSATTFPQ